MSEAAAQMVAPARDVVEKPRLVEQRVPAKEQNEGDGVRVWRSIGGAKLRNLDPFLMLDEAKVTPPAGFPDHPHRGFETVTYVLKGAFSHEDFMGNKGIINEGDLQWMTAGRGILHNGLPATWGENHALQLWVNLSAKEKMCEPAYQELKASDIPEVEADGVFVRVIAGTSLGVTSKVYTRTPTMFLDVSLQPGAEFHQTIPDGWNGFVYTLEGEAIFGSEASAPTGAHVTLQLKQAGDGLIVWNRSESKARFMLICGQPLDEPVAQYGPFVMNTRDELMEAMNDFQRGKRGFELAVGWQSAGSTLPGVGRVGR